MSADGWEEVGGSSPPLLPPPQLLPPPLLKATALFFFNGRARRAFSCSRLLLPPGNRVQVPVPGGGLRRSDVTAGEKNNQDDADFYHQLGF